MVSYKALNTAIESTFTNTCYRIRDCDWGQVAATRESIITYNCYRIRDYDWLQAAAVTESIIANTCYWIRDYDWCQAAARFVSITNYLSALSLLNGRKVKP